MEKHVEQRLRQCEEREERSARRQEETLSTEFDKISKRLTSASPRRMRVTVKPPVRVRLEVQRKLEESEWLVRLRIVLAGSTVERICICCNNYEEAKRELLPSRGKTLLTGKQRSEESFQ